MTKQQKEEVILDTTYIKIIFNSNISKGSLILKSKFFELNIKKITKLLKDCEWHIIKDYKLNLEETLSFDKEYQECVKHIKRLMSYRDYYIYHCDYERTNEYINDLKTYSNQLKEIKDRIIKERR